MHESGRELELKFVITGEQFDRAKSRFAKTSLADGKAITQTLHSTYFDTPQCILHVNGLSLRVRQSENGLCQTVKAETGVKGGVSHPIEIEVPVTERVARLDIIPDKSIRDRVRELVGKDRLRPVFETVVERTTQQLVTPEGGKLELALDKGIVKTAKASRDICEAELELKLGDPKAVFRIVDELFAGDMPKPSEHNKSDLGYRLLAGRLRPDLAPLKSSLPELKRDSDCGTALAAILRPVTGQILHNWSVVLASDDPEGAHQLRVGLRRLRTALKAFKPVMKRGALFDLDDKLRDVAHLVGELRDADVQAMEIVKPLETHGDWGVAVEPLSALLKKRREETRVRVRQTLQNGDFLKLQMQIALLPALVSGPASAELKPKASQPVRKLACKILAKSWRKVLKRARKIDELTVEERHALRKDVKTLRYAVEFFSALYSAKKVARFTAKLERLQDLFGYMNDVAGAQRLAKLIPDGKRHAPARHAAGYVIGWHTARAEDIWQDARAVWKVLKATSRFWAT